MQIVGPILDEVSFDHRRDPRQGLLWLLSWGVALAFGGCMAGWVPHARPAAAPDFFGAQSAANSASAAAGKASNPYGALVDPGFFQESKAAPPDRDSSVQASLEVALARSAAQFASAAAGKVSNPYGLLVDPGFLRDPAPASLSRESSLEASLEAAAAASLAAIPQPQDVPLPPKRDVALTDEAAPAPAARRPERASPATPALPDRRATQPSDNVARATPPADDRNIFQRLFGTGRPSGADLAYAAPESRVAGNAKVAALAATDRASGFSIFARSSPPPGYDKWTAVYDISARTVYLPDGTRLEAHSGLGDRLDDPRHVNERARGATPPHLYELSPREELFHGVQALRLTPVGEGDVFGRAGLLAHSYMLGPNGDSNGCVSFKNYDAFLRAYQQGQVKRLAVVARLD
ncbi:MAG TPA: DUF2778 domain-containing protein [Roseiarcus sp.]|nr:DUF2778 domain-containing protein [Roseiarcus sp.]